MNLINFLGMGIVANNKESNTNTINVYLPSQFPMSDGQVVGTAEQSEQTSQNAEGMAVKSQVLKSNVVPANWRDFGGHNRMTSPDVREGSQVAIYQVTGQDTYYWTTHGLNPNTLRMETVIFGFSANPNLKANVDFNMDDFYTFSISTHTGEIRFRSSQKNGEATTFEMLIDAMKGRIMIGGKEKNYLIMDDVAHSLTYTNVDKSTISVSKENITMYCEDTIALNAKKNINMLCKDMAIQCGNSFGLQAQTATINADVSMAVTCPETTWKGNITQEGNYEQTGNYDLTGAETISGDLTIGGTTTSKGNFITEGDISSGTVGSFNNHKHKENGDGGGTTDGPTG